MANNIPIGCRFRPTEEELISLLWLKVTNQLPETDDVKEMTLYGEDASPWQVFGDDNDIRWQIFDENGKKANTKKMVYVFTKLTKLSDKKTARTAGLGTWDGETKKTPIEDLRTGDKIGSRKMLSYVLNSGSNAVKGGWIMHEYSLDGAMLDGINSSHNTDYVICRIIRDDSKFTKVKASGKKGKVVEEEKSENPGRPQVLGRRKLNLEQENSPAKKMITRNNVSEAPMNVDSVVIASEGDRPPELPNYLLNDGGMQSVSGWEGEGFGSVDGTVQSTSFLSERLQQGTSSSYPGKNRYASNNERMENSELTGTLGSGTSVNQVTACENLDNCQQFYEVQLCVQKSSSSVDCGDQMMTYQAGQVASNDFLDPVSWWNILKSVEAGDENIIGQLPLPPDEWLQEGLQRI